MACYSAQGLHCTALYLRRFLLQNVSQVVTHIVLPDAVRGRHPTVLRSCYSELRRLEAQGFGIFYSNSEDYLQSRFGENCCFQLGFLKVKLVT